MSTGVLLARPENLIQASHTAHILRVRVMKKTPDIGQEGREYQK